MVLEVEKQLHHCAPPAARFPSHQNHCRFLLLIWQCPGGNKMLHNTDKKSQITACSSLEAWHGDGDDNRIGEHSGKEKSSMNSEIMLLFPDTCCAAWRGIESRISKLWNIVFHFLGSRFSFIKSWFLKKSIKKKNQSCCHQLRKLFLLQWHHDHMNSYFFRNDNRYLKKSEPMTSMEILASEMFDFSNILPFWTVITALHL